MLNGLKVLVTRPQQQAVSLCEKVNAAGGEAIAFPTIDIVAIEIPKIEGYRLEKQDIIIFVSRNSVLFFETEWQSLLAKNALVIAIGGGTAKFMQESGFKTVYQPLAPAGSESVLAMPQLQDVNSKNVLIVRGQEGRELLAETLAERGATTHYLEVYQRMMPVAKPSKVKQVLSAHCIIISSENSLENLCQLVGEENIKNKHLIVVSERIKQYAIGQGFTDIDVADDASDSAVMRQLERVGEY